MRRSLIALTLAAACDAPLTGAEALEALEESMQSGRGSAATEDAVVVSTEFTLGAAAADAAAELAAFWQSQAPCAVVTVSGPVVTVAYGAAGGSCTWNGKTYSGITEVTLTRTGVGDLQVDHRYLGLSDGIVTVDGAATVTWDGAALTRDVTTAHTWTDNASGATVDVTGAHALGTLGGDGFFADGVTLDGARQWTSDAGDWDLQFEGVEARWIDPAPQAGTFEVTNPDGKVLTVTFSRLDDTTLQAVLTGPRREWVFEIGALGQVSAAE
jgi:hypothetical protein